MTDTPRDDETFVADERGPEYRRRPTAETDADEPLQAERDAARRASPNTVTVGPDSTRRTDDDE